MIQPQLQTKRLTLRPFRSCDVEDSLAYRNDQEFARFLPNIPQPFTREHAKAFVELNMTEPWETSPTFAVVLDDTVIGTVNFTINPDAKSAMVGYAIGRNWWGQGLAHEATHAAMAWAAATHGLIRIWASTEAGNSASIRLMERLGMSQEPLEREDQVRFSKRYSETRDADTTPMR